MHSIRISSTLCYFIFSHALCQNASPMVKMIVIDYVKERHRVIIWRAEDFCCSLCAAEILRAFYSTHEVLCAHSTSFCVALYHLKSRTTNSIALSHSLLSFFCDFLTRLRRKLSIMCIKNYYWIPPRNYIDSKARLIHLKASAHDNSRLVCKILEQSETMNYCVFRRLRKTLPIEWVSIKSPSKHSCRLDWFACRCFPTRKLRQSEKMLPGILYW